MGRKLAGKVALVTGASKGIGAGIAKALAAEGASVIVNYASSKEGADRVVAEIVAAGGKATAIQADVSKKEEIARLFTETQAAYGRLDVLVNNAGVFEYLPLEAVGVEAFRRQFDLNVMGLLLASKQAAALFGEDGGSIINVSSAITGLAPANSSIYTATKAAVDAISRVLAKELGPRGIRVNSLSPGMVETEGFHAAGFSGSDMERGIIAQTPLGRIGQPDDIGKVAVFLASDDAGWVTGQILQAAGGAV